MTEVILAKPVADRLSENLPRRERQALVDAIDRLQHDPIGRSVLVGTSNPSVQTLRVTPVDDHLRLVYRIDDSTSTVQILGILDRNEALAD